MVNYIMMCNNNKYTYKTKMYILYMHARIYTNINYPSGHIQHQLLHLKKEYFGNLSYQIAFQGFT